LAKACESFHACVRKSHWSRRADKNPTRVVWSSALRRSRWKRQPSDAVASLEHVLKLTQEHINRAFRIARWYGRRARRAEISDLESAALEGLAKAARDWDPEHGGGDDQLRANNRSFWNFAFIRILGEMRDELRRFDYLTRDQRAKVIEDDQGRLSLDGDEVDWIVPLGAVPLDSAIDRGAAVEDSRRVSDLIEDRRNDIDEFELRDVVCRASARLSERARLIVEMRDLEGYSNVELAEALGVVEGRVSQLRGIAFDRMRGHIGDSLVDAA
jgi:RNA polymerase sigma factor (sigma-70 family)